MNLRIGIIGATGIIGRELVFQLDSLNYQIALFASPKSSTKSIAINDKIFAIQPISPEIFSKLDIAIFATSATISAELIPSAVQSGCRVIDLSDHYRLAKNVPLFLTNLSTENIINVPIVACPNCTTSLLMKVLYPLHQKFSLDRFFACTYQSVSGAGARAVEEWKSEITDGNFAPKVFQKTIAHNCIPQIGKIENNDYSEEENSIINESRKILNLPELKISATCVRVSCKRSHGIALTAQFNKKITPEAAVQELLNHPELRHECKTPHECQGDDKIYFSRVRRDNILNNAISIWITGDQILAGTIPNVVRIISAIQAAF